MRAPLIAVISVGIAAAAPAVAVSAAQTQSHTQSKVAVVAAQGAPAAIKTNLHQAPGPVTMQTPTKTEQRHIRLVHRFLRLRHRANRLIAKRDRRKARVVSTPAQLQWSNRGLKRAIRKLRKRVVRVRSQLRARRAGLTPGVRAILERIAFCESHGNPRAINATGTFRGKYQFNYGTWRAVGGKGDPAAASEAEQDRRAALLMKRSGTSPWPVCG